MRKYSCSLFFGGPVPHYFYTYVPLLVRHPLGILLVERLLYMPCFQALALYMLAIFEVQRLTVVFANFHSVMNNLNIRIT